MDQTATTASLLSQPRAWIEIHRGRTRFRRRPFSGDRFLIGSGSNCDLQLGGRGIPIIHSLIVQSEGELRIEALVPAPPLIVAGRPVKSAVLTENDRVEIGSFVLTAHQAVVVPGASNAAALDWEAALDVATLMEQHQKDLQDDSQLSSLNAGQLVDRIEGSLAVRLEADRQVRCGLAALLEAAQSLSVSELPQDVTDLEAVLARIGAQATQIAQGAQALREREQTLASQSDLIIALHERVIAECTEILDRVSQPEESRSRLRLSA